MEHYLAFNKEWFGKNQKRILKFLNGPLGWVFRILLRIHGDRSAVGKNRITEIAPNYIRWGNTYEFRTHWKFSKRVYYSLKPLWWLLHFWDWVLADRFVPRLGFGFTTLTAYPDPDPETATVDGYAYQSADATWATIISSSGSGANDSITLGVAFSIFSGLSSNSWAELVRSIFLFDTSTLTSGASIASAVLSLYGESKMDNLSIEPDLNIYSSAPASNTAVVGGDFDSLGSTAFATAITYDNLSTSAYNDWTFNATGLAAISKTGVSKFGARNANYDVAATDPEWASFLVSRLKVYFADRIGTSEDPKLVIEATGVSSTTTTTSTTSTTTSTTSTTSTSSTTSTTSTSSSTTTSNSSSSTTSSSTTSNSSTTSTNTTTAPPTVQRKIILDIKPVKPILEIKRTYRR